MLFVLWRLSTTSDLATTMASGRARLCSRTVALFASATDVASVEPIPLSLFW